MGKSWDETETPFAKDVLRFVNKETSGDVAWFRKRDDGTWETEIQLPSTFLLGITAESEESLAVKYWEHYYERVQASAKRYAGFLDRHIFNRERYAKSQERLVRWDGWRNEHAAHFSPA